MSATAKNDSRLLELDGLRGSAVLMVLSWHFVGAMIDPKLGAWASGLYRVLILGRSGVDLFFVLSGFLITQIILKRRRSGGRFLLAFYMRRALRIIPPYSILVGVFWLFVVGGVHSSAFGAEMPFWRHLSFTQNFWMSEHNQWGPGAISVTWSVAIEEHYYLFFPLLVLCVNRRYLPLVLLVVGVASVATRAWLHKIAPDNPFSCYVMTLSRLDGLAAGGLIAFYNVAGFFERLSPAVERIFVRVTYALMLFIPLLGVAIAYDLPNSMFYFGHTYLTLLFSSVLIFLLAKRGSPGPHWLRSSPLRFLGKISYSVYLFHPLILSSVFMTDGRPERLAELCDGALALAALALTIGWSVFLFRYLEGPLINYGKRFQY